MYCIVGNTIEEIEQDLAKLKIADGVAKVSGQAMGCGGATLDDLEKGLRALADMLGQNSKVKPQKIKVTQPTVEDEDKWEDRRRYSSDDVYLTGYPDPLERLERHCGPYRDNY